MAIAEPIVLIVLLALCTAYLVDGSFNPFLYFRF
jgi:alginate O-acetyltransferase complex protein AlgI